MAKGAKEIRTILKQDVETFAAYQDVQKKLDDFYMARIGKRMVLYIFRAACYIAIKNTKFRFLSTKYS